MWNEPTKERLARIPKLYDTEEIPVQDKEIYLHFFLGGSDWFISETDGEDIMFGFCILIMIMRWPNGGMFPSQNFAQSK